MTSELAPPPKVGARIVPPALITKTSRLALVGAQLVDLLLEVGVVGGEQVVGQIQPLPARIVAVEAAFEIAGDRRQAALLARAHADRVQLERRHAVVVHTAPTASGRCCTSGEMISFGAPISESALATTKALSPVSASNGHIGDGFLSSSSMSTPPMMGERHRRGAEFAWNRVIEK